MKRVLFRNYCYINAAADPESGRERGGQPKHVLSSPLLKWVLYMLWCLRATCPPAPPFLLNYIMQLPWRLHKFLLPNCSLCLSPCKWQPPWPPFASALVTDWYQYPGCPPHMHVAPLYKRAGSPDPLLTFWLNVIPVTSRSKARNLT